ncbi:oligopeptide ABC transporter ATP-binding protein [Gottschalkia acidurici 9a]|uniref:Oligopeptide ABC transporter ATP-binding protein n=1 Tax=Gottschalkia acidurici (strain ATCC 7906 / DSM 604 / BCRC 14475 / CIP 104303 / KCTC 5404 / NCIMB 10678 / 9a) TaxID=1128398 RepID=K0AZD6_GOTA9|nr:ABC transporter ATP-binding protein [Gottschalkia acidurici]AFS78152.1 oligopeptide ABC transporter ATP-binding protein [Gottschalkia acidurici 9a]
MENKNFLLEVKFLKTIFETERGQVTAVDGVSFNIRPGEIIGIVGESGCGKSVTVQSIMRLFDEKNIVTYDGEILYKSKDILKMKYKDMQKVRGNEISMIFQDPISSLNPVFSIGNQLTEAIILHQNISKKEAWNKGIEMLKLTGIPSPEVRMKEYPHQLSGGMQQRIMIAMALSCNPSLLIADEPTTALDVTIQSQILNLILDINKRLGMAVIFITHDLGVVSQICDRIMVMYLGKIVEESDNKDLFKRPLHPYTKGLLNAIPSIDGKRGEVLSTIKGSVPSLFDRPKGCIFVNRCEFADKKCHDEAPEIVEDNESHFVRCFYYNEIETKAGENSGKK